MAAEALDQLIRLLAKLPGLGPRSARRAALFLLRHREGLMVQLAGALRAAAAEVHPCSLCGNLDGADPCRICTDPRRTSDQILVVEDVDDLWAMERGGLFRGRYHVLGGTLSALAGIGPEDLGIERLLGRIERDEVAEVVLATGVTVDGQTTAHYVAERIARLAERDHPVRVTRLAHGLPVGGELNYLDEGTLEAALRARQSVA